MRTRAIALPLALVLSVALAGCNTSSESEPEDAAAEPPAVAEPDPAENDAPGAPDTDPEAETEAESSLPAADAPEDAVAVAAEPPPVANEIELPPGFAAFRWQEELSQPTALAFSPDGRLFVAEREGKLWSFRDLDGNGAADERVLFADGLTELLGFAILDDARVYVSDRGRISLAEDLDGDGSADIVTPLIRALPSGSHQNNGIALGPDGRLYLTLGSTCNECVEDNDVSASILALDLDSLQLEVYASGLRNSYDLVFTPDGSLWATDNGSDPPCATPTNSTASPAPRTTAGRTARRRSPRSKTSRSRRLNSDCTPAPTDWSGSILRSCRLNSAGASTLRSSAPARGIPKSASACSSPSWRRTGRSPCASSPPDLATRWTSPWGRARTSMLRISVVA